MQKPLNFNLKRCPPGFTLVELLVVIAIIGVLASLLLPAAQAARESGRRLQCANNFKQIGLAAVNHLDAHKHYPSNGWGYAWIGDPDRGFGRKQPGGWIYNLLPFLEQSDLHQLGANEDALSPARLAANAKRIVTPLAVFICPSRRNVEPFDPPAYGGHFIQPRYSDPVMKTARSCYCVNSGISYSDPYDPDLADSYPIGADGPGTLADSERPEWQAVFTLQARAHFGISMAGTTIRVKQVTDGLSKTYFAGEKRINPDNYTNGQNPNDNETMYSGANGDISCWASTYYEPVVDTPGDFAWGIYGAAHPAVFHTVFCDGSVHAISYEIDPWLHQCLGDRRDGEIVAMNGL